MIFKKVAIYLRKSRFDDESETLDEVLKRHEKLLNDYCERNNLIIEKVYKEVVSGDSIEKRPQVQKLLEDISEGLYDGVVVIEIERLSRGNPIDQFEILETFKEAKAKIYTLQKVYDFSSDNDIDEEYFEFGLFMSRREYKTIRRRLIRGKQQALKEGFYVAPNLPYGYSKKRIDKGYVLIPNEEAEVVKMIFNKFVYENYFIGEIKNYLNDNGIKPVNGGLWTATTVRQVMRNKTYLGYIPAKRRSVYYKGKHDPIIDEDTFYKAQAMLDINAAKVPEKLKLVNPFATLIYCQNKTLCNSP